MVEGVDGNTGRISNTGQQLERPVCRFKKRGKTQELIQGLDPTLRPEAKRLQIAVRHWCIGHGLTDWRTRQVQYIVASVGAAPFLTCSQEDPCGSWFCPVCLKSQAADLKSDWSDHQQALEATIVVQFSEDVTEASEEISRIDTAFREKGLRFSGIMEPNWCDLSSPNKRRLAETLDQYGSDITPCLHGVIWSEGGSTFEAKRILPEMGRLMMKRLVRDGQEWEEAASIWSSYCSKARVHDNGVYWNQDVIRRIDKFYSGFQRRRVELGVGSC